MKQGIRLRRNQCNRNASKSSRHGAILGQKPLNAVERNYYSTMHSHSTDGPYMTEPVTLPQRGCCKRAMAGDDRMGAAIDVRLRVKVQEVTTSKSSDGAGPSAWQGTNRYTPIRTTGDRPPLICLFPGEPGARELADALPPDQPVYQFHEPNMDGTSVFPTVEELAVAFLKDVRQIQERGPYQLCGYSAVGLVAYEMARMLRAQGEQVALLALFDIWHPRFRQMLTQRELMRYRLARAVVRLKKYRRLLRDRKFGDFGLSLREYAKKVGWRAVRSLYRTSNREVPKAMQVIESVASHLAYTPMAYPGRVVLVRPKDWFAQAVTDESVGWRQCVTGGVDVHFVRGDHGKIVHAPYVRELVEKIVPYLSPPSPGPSQGIWS